MADAVEALRRALEERRRLTRAVGEALERERREALVGRVARTRRLVEGAVRLIDARREREARERGEWPPYDEHHHGRRHHHHHHHNRKKHHHHHHGQDDREEGAVPRISGVSAAGVLTSRTAEATQRSNWTELLALQSLASPAKAAVVEDVPARAEGGRVAAAAPLPSPAATAAAAATSAPAQRGHANDGDDDGPQTLAHSSTVDLYQRMAEERMRGETPASLRPLSRFRAAAMTVVFYHRARTRVAWRAMTRKFEHLRTFGDAVDLYTDLCRKWFRLAVRKPVVSVLSDAELNLAVSSAGGLFGRKKRVKADEARRRVIKIKVRVRAVLDGLCRLASGGGRDGQPPPLPLLSFASRYLVSNGAFFPGHGIDAAGAGAPLPSSSSSAVAAAAADKYLWPSERANLAFDRFSATTDMTPQRRKMMLCNFLVSRVLVGMVLRPWAARIGSVEAGQRGGAARNLRVLASVLQRCADKAMETLLGTATWRGRGLDRAVTDELEPEGSALYEATKEVVDEMAPLVVAFVEEMHARVSLLDAS